MHSCVEGSKRQLPPWMIQKASANNVNNSDVVVKVNCSVDKRDIITANATKKEHKRETSRRKSNLNTKCEVKQKRDLDPLDGGSDDNAQTKKKKDDRSMDRVHRSSKKKRRILEDLDHGVDDVYPVEAYSDGRTEHTTQKKKKKKDDRSMDRVQKPSKKKSRILEDLSHDGNDVFPVQASSDDAVELTVEDLIAIAEQYVKEHENKEQKETSVRPCESKRQFRVTTEAGTTLDSPCEKEKISNSGSEVLYNPTPADELIATSTSQTGDPAQDMLDLFLGPLLRKTVEKEEKSKSIVENLEVTHEFTRQSQDEVAQVDTVPLTKKRNTLKDKVAMFLD